jgi:hypothetical protein
MILSTSSGTSRPEEIIARARRGRATLTQGVAYGAFRCRRCDECRDRIADVQQADVQQYEYSWAGYSGSAKYLCMSPLTSWTGVTLAGSFFLLDTRPAVPVPVRYRNCRTFQRSVPDYSVRLSNDGAAAVGIDESSNGRWN